MNISHGNRDKSYFPTEKWSWYQQEKEPFLSFLFASCSPEYGNKSCLKTLRETFSNFISRSIDYCLPTGFINRRERMYLLKWKHLLNRHKLNLRRLSKTAVLIGGDNIFKYWKTLPKQTQAHNPAFFISIQSTDYSFRHNFFPLCKPATVLDLVYISMKILSYSLNLLLFSEYIQGCYVQSMLLILRGGF